MKKIIGITGGIASGKSTVCQYLIDLGYYVIDSDEISRRFTLVGGPIYQRIKKAFGQEYFLPNHELDRAKLADLIFHDPIARSQLNDLSHPLIVEEIRNLIQNSSENIIFLDIPLLFEANLSYLCDTIVCVYVKSEVQIERLMNRDQISKEYAEAKIKSQMSLEEKKILSDYVIESEEDFQDTKKNIINVIEQIKGE